MRKSLLFIFSVSSLFSLSLNEEIYQGLHYYNTHQYEKAYKFFNRLFQSNLDNERINFYLGITALKLKKYDKAVEAFERVLIKNPNNLRARVEYARALFYLKNYDESRREFLKVLRNESVPIEVKKNIEKFLTLIDKLDKRVFYNAFLSVGIKHDNNIDNDVGAGTPIQDTIFDTNLSRGNSKKGDFINEDLAVLNQRYDIGERGGWKMNNSLVAFAQNYFKYSDNNVLYFSVGSELSTKKDDYLYKNRFFFNKILLDNSSYLNSYGVTFSLYKPVDKFLFNPAVTLKRKDFENDNLDSINKAFSLSAVQKLQNMDVLKYRVAYIDENAKVDAENSYRKSSFKIDYEKRVKKIKFNVGYHFFVKDYKEKSSVFLRKRKDRQSHLKGNVLYDIKKNLKAKFGVEYIKNSSTRDANDYSKLIESLNLEILF